MCKSQATTVASDARGPTPAEFKDEGACCQALAKEMTHDLDVNFNDHREGIAEPRHENSGHVGECS